MRKIFLRYLLIVSFPLISGMTLLQTENALSGNERPATSKDDCSWPMEQMSVRKTWKRLQDRGFSKPGENITVAHLDTGIIPLLPLLQTHQFSAGRLGLQLPDGSLSHADFNFVQPQSDPWDNDPKSPSFGHGTSTASLILGWKDNANSDGLNFRGVAPWIRLLPIKVTDSVLMVGRMSTGGTADIRNLAAGIEMAARMGADIISISLGALFDSERILQNAVRQAVDEGIIVIAAAGQTFPVNLIPLPARLPGVIAVSASSKEKKPWKEGFTGKDIAWAAPGEDICHIKAKQVGSSSATGNSADKVVNLFGRNGEQLSFTDVLVCASGTSYSTAYTAAAAALWLQYHSREKLHERYGRKNISSLFKTIAMQYAMDVPPDWDQNKHGAGILNIQRLIEAPLP
jgi:thermitase